MYNHIPRKQKCALYVRVFISKPKVGILVQMSIRKFFTPEKSKTSDESVLSRIVKVTVFHESC